MLKKNYIRIQKGILLSNIVLIVLFYNAIYLRVIIMWTYAVKIILYAYVISLTNKPAFKKGL